jgi:FMN-dependent NADH-azoreductase
MKLLHIDSSPLGEASVSRLLTQSIVDGYRRSAPGLRVTHRDLGAAAPDHLDAELLKVVRLHQEEGLTPRQRTERARTDELIEEFLAADIVVIGAPMYNFSVPSQLKAWIDRIAQAGRTFRYTEAGPVGLAGGKTVVIASSRGGVYSTSEQMRALDHQESYLRTVLGFLGVTDVRVVRAEGVAMGEGPRATALAAAQGEIDRLVLRPAA